MVIPDWDKISLYRRRDCRGPLLQAVHSLGTGLRLLACLTFLLLASVRPAAAADNVTRWTKLADAYGGGLANWRTLAIMHQAMHDALNAASPRYERWESPTDDEPLVTGALPGAAMAAAAASVLSLLHPEQQDDTDRALIEALEGASTGPDRHVGILLGAAIGKAAVLRRANDGRTDVRPFVSSNEPGRWARTPQEYGGSNTTSTRPFLFELGDVLRHAPPPPALDSDVYRRDLEEVRRLGGTDSRERSEWQGDAALFWAAQSSQRGYLHLAVRLLDKRPRSGGLSDHARIMSLLTAGLADSAILTWREKEHFAFWRPVTAIRAGSAGVKADPTWQPLLETPPFPEYPSGHAADCYTGSALLQAAFGADLGAVAYVSQEGSEASLDSLAIGMGQHGQLGNLAGRVERRFPSLAAAAEECAESRIWAGAHFRAGLNEARRLGELIADRAAVLLPPVRQALRPSQAH